MITSKSGLRKAVLDTLIADWPLGMKGIYFRVKKCRPVTYHAVYKVVRQMVAEGILEREDRKYFISRGWIRQVLKFGEKLTLAYARSLERPNMLVFDTVAESDDYFMRVGVKEGHKKFIQCRHLWWEVFRPEATLSAIEREWVCKSPTFIICNGDTPIDRWCVKFERKMGRRIKLGIPCATNCDVVVSGDRVYEIYYPRKLMQVIDSAYSRAKNVAELDLRGLLKKFYKRRTKIIVIVTKNRAVADQIKEQTLAHFSSEQVRGL
jgi:regulator of extracellular matrix RemA (YlzA/DUF370 family)